MYETARSLYERAEEHWQDVQSGKLESHMLKHWQTEHMLEEGQPRFKIRLVKTCTDALTRQISESVRINLRGTNVINSKSEYSRCCLPRLTIDIEGWKSAKELEAKKKTDDGVGYKQSDEEVMWEEERMADWNKTQERSKGKRKVR